MNWSAATLPTILQGVAGEQLLDPAIESVASAGHEEPAEEGLACRLHRVVRRGRYTEYVWDDDLARCVAGGPKPGREAHSFNDSRGH